MSLVGVNGSGMPDYEDRNVSYEAKVEMAESLPLDELIDDELSFIECLDAVWLDIIKAGIGSGVLSDAAKAKIKEVYDREIESYIERNLDQ